MSGKILKNHDPEKMKGRKKHENYTGKNISKHHNKKHLLLCIMRKRNKRILYRTQCSNINYQSDMQNKTHIFFGRIQKQNNEVFYL